jgi:hypothetical protein
MDDLQRLDIIALKRLYIEKTKDLYRQILWGKDWKDVEEQKRYVTALSIELDKRLNRSQTGRNPAEFNSR